MHLESKSEALDIEKQLTTREPEANTEEPVRVEAPQSNGKVSANFIFKMYKFDDHQH